MGSKTIKKICHCLLILIEGGITIFEAIGNLTRARLGFRQVATFGQDVIFVWVVCFHAVSMADLRDDCKR